jgi:LysR family transcriptional regulator, carnitine catabolism transcriptional activator
MGSRNPPSLNATIRHLRAFVSVARHRSFSRAATELHLSQPALTMTIRQLEDIAGVGLFDRTTRNVLLSPEGEELFPAVERIVGDFDAAILKIRMTGDSRKSLIRIAVVDSVATKLLPRVLGPFLTFYPTLQVQLREGNSSEVRRWVQRNEADLGFGSKDVEEVDLDFQPLFRDQLGLAARSDHPLFEGQHALKWEDLAGYDFIGLTIDTATGPILDHIPGLPISITEPRYSVSSHGAVWALLENGFGITTTPALAMEFNTNPLVRFCGLCHPVAWRKVFTIKRRGRSLTPVAQKLVRLVKSEIGVIAAKYPRIELA